MARFFASTGVFFSVISVILLIFGLLGQVNDSYVPRHLSLFNVDVSALPAVIASAAVNLTAKDITYSGSDKYVSGATQGQGLRAQYSWGFWSYCAATKVGTGEVPQYCDLSGFNERTRPVDSLYKDIPTVYQDGFNVTIPDSLWNLDGTAGDLSHAANAAVFLGALLTVLTTLVGCCAQKWAFVLSAVLAALSFVFVGAGTAVYTAVVMKAQDALTGNALGIKVSIGYGLWIMWGATAGVLLAVLPYFLACCAGFRKKKEVSPTFVRPSGTYVRMGERN
ncbi:integral membrane protein [Pseudohyphozyma bogoriensis]|nr:integral membrane protein [Pseudohyphozyma bogoriensis]